MEVWINLSSFSAASVALNGRGITTPRGSSWTPAQTSKVTSCKPKVAILHNHVAFNS